MSDQPQTRRDPFCQRDRLCVRPANHAGPCRHAAIPPASIWDEPLTSDERAAALASLGIQYGRDDVDYATWYSDWAKRLAATMSARAILRELGRCESQLSAAARAHHRAIAATHSMTSQTQRRAQSRNVVAGTGERATALRGALQIHLLFPEHAHD